MFYPHLITPDLQLPGDPGYSDPLNEAVRALHEGRDYIVTGPEGITAQRFIEATDAPTRRRRGIRMVSRKK